MFSQPLLTIAVPTYNGSNTIRAMLDILLPQYDSRVEFLVSDNCSTDNTKELIENYRKRYPFIKYIRNESNIGPDANFLQCMRLAKGKFTFLLSDDDILVEGSLQYILQFLEDHPDVSLVFLNTVGFIQNYVDLKHCFIPRRLVPIERNLCTTNKKIFMRHANYYWGFMSSFLWATDRFREIDNPDQFFGTYWLQSYIHILCVSKTGSQLGLIKQPCVAAGNYINVANFDTSLVDGIYYRKMLDFAVDKAGFDKSQLDKLYAWRISMLGANAIIKERSSGIKKTNIKRLISCTWSYPYAWVRLFPIVFMPSYLCQFLLWLWKLKHQLKSQVRVNRPE